HLTAKWHNTRQPQQHEHCPYHYHKRREHTPLFSTHRQCPHAIHHSIHVGVSIHSLISDSYHSNGGICHWLRPIHRVTRLSTIRWLDAVLMLPSCAISSAVVGESVNIYRTLDAPRHNDSVETQYALTNTNYAHGLVLLQLPD